MDIERGNMAANRTAHGDARRGYDGIRDFRVTSSPSSIVGNREHLFSFGRGNRTPRRRQGLPGRLAAGLFRCRAPLSGQLIDPVVSRFKVGRRGCHLVRGHRSEPVSVERPTTWSSTAEYARGKGRPDFPGEMMRKGALYYQKSLSSWPRGCEHDCLAIHRCLCVSTSTMGVSEDHGRGWKR